MSANWHEQDDTSGPCTPATTMYHLQSQGSERPHLYIQTDLPKPPAMPNFYGIHPHRWTKEDVRQWLEWCIEEYALEGVQVDKFACMNGKALCMLTKQNFSERAKNVGDVLYNTLQQRLVAATSPDALILPPGAFYPGMVSPSRDQRVLSGYDCCLPGVASPASPHGDHLYTMHSVSPLVAASPPSMKPHAPFFRQYSMPNGRPYLRPYRPSSRSPSPRLEDETPMNLTKTGGESSRESTPTTPAPRHSLIIPNSNSTTPEGRRTPSPPQHSHHGGYPPRLHRQVSEGSALYHHPHHHHHSQHSPQHYPHPAPGSRSPARRPSPSSMGMPEPAHKVAKLSSSSQSTSSPLMSPNYLSPVGHPFRATSPEGFRDLSKKLAIVRMDSQDDTTFRNYDDISSQSHFGSPSLLDSRQVEAISDPEAEDATTGSDISAASECDSPVEDGKASVRQYGGGNGHGAGGGHVTQNGHHHHHPEMHQQFQNGRHPSREGQVAINNGNHIPHSLQIPVTVNAAENTDEFYNPDKPDGEGGQGDTKLLWEFIYQLLRNPEYTSLLRWEDEARLVFRIINPAKLAYLWGLQKSRDNMTYEKLSRALRYYYRMNIIVKEPHRRLTYRFVKPPEHIQRGQKGAKPGVAHKRRSSGPHVDVPRIAVTTPSMTSPNTNVIHDMTSADTANVIRHASEEELNQNMFKQEVLTNSVGASVFPTNMPLSMSMTVHEQGSSGGYISLNHSPRKNSIVRPESLPCTVQSTHGSFGLNMKQDEEESGREKNTHTISNKETDCAASNLEAAQNSQNRASPLQDHGPVVKRELPQLSPMNNNDEWHDREAGTTEETEPVTEAVSNAEVANEESH